MRLLAPFDPLVWDRRKFEQLWDWAYRFEAYTPAAKRKHGYYALPLLWRDRVIGWANVSGRAGALRVDAGYVSGRAPRDRAFKHAFEAEVERLTDVSQPFTHVTTFQIGGMFTDATSISVSPAPVEQPRQRQVGAKPDAPRHRRNPALEPGAQRILAEKMIEQDDLARGAAHSAQLASHTERIGDHRHHIRHQHHVESFRRRTATARHRLRAT